MPEAAHRVVELSEGNPLILTEMVRAGMAYEGGQVDSRLPISIQALFERRLKKLSPSARKVAERASSPENQFASTQSPLLTRTASSGPPERNTTMSPGRNSGIRVCLGRPGEQEGDQGGEREAQVEVPEPGVYSVLLGGRSYEARVEERPEGGVVVVIDGFRFEIEVSDPRRWTRKSAGRGDAGVQRITAPMPGKVVRVLVSPGDAVDGVVGSA